jgi:AraC-like DNA-binding protein
MQGRADCGDAVTRPIVLAVTSGLALTRLRNAFGSGLLQVPNGSTLVLTVQETAADLVITEPWDSLGCPMSGPVAQCARRWPSIPIAAYCDQESQIREMFLLARAGATYLILSGHDDDTASLRRLVSKSAMTGAASEVLRVATVRLPQDVVPIIELCLTNVSNDQSLDDIALSLGLCSRTVSRRAQRAGFSGSKSLVSTCRLLLALGMLIRCRQSVEQVAFRLGFYSASGLRNMLHRHTGLSVSAALEAGGAEYWAERLLVRGVKGFRETEPPNRREK